ncbi:MAG: type II toxin-antitoxin system VapC family toxin [Melioribacteraceae bacterium]|nr:type II toxin-antitoxin system VapC family toxin [Melioribacteraceae bacterium]
MNLLEITQNERVIIDANILVYATTGKSVQSMDFLERCVNKEVTGILTTHIISEVIHVLMIHEAREIGALKGSNPAKKLSGNIQLVKSLSRYKISIRDLMSIGLQLEPLQREDIISAMSLQGEYGLLTNDALFLAIAERLGVRSIVSADSIFKNIKGFNIYCPDDL